MTLVRRTRRTDRLAYIAVTLAVAQLVAETRSRRRWTSAENRTPPRRVIRFHHEKGGSDMARKTFCAIAVITAVVAGALVAAAPASASTRVQDQLAQVMTRLPGGVQTSANQVAWSNGRIVLTLASSDVARPATSGLGACPSGYWCLYQNSDFNQGLLNDGRMLALTGCDGVPGNLTNYGFNDQTTSWYNHSRFNNVRVYRDINGAPEPPLWVMNSEESVSNVGSDNNDKASSINC